MSITTQRVPVQSPEPEVHDEVLDNNPDRIGIWKYWRKTSRSKDKKQQQAQSTFDSESGNITWATLVGGECSHLCAIPAPCRTVLNNSIVMFGSLGELAEQGVRVYMLWFNFILGLNCIFHFSNSLPYITIPKNVRKIKFKPRINLNHNICRHSFRKAFMDWYSPFGSSISWLV